MAGLYPSTLFHFTKTKEALFGILADNFKIFYAKETIAGKGEPRIFHAPMVSFCDLRLSEAGNHMESYGEYGLGLAKRWALAHGLNPVAYWNGEARLIDNLFDKLERDHADVWKEPSVSETVRKAAQYDNLIDLLRFVKNYEGRLERRNGEVVDPYRFADEREWRYVPETVYPPFLSRGVDKASWSSRITESLEFEPDDIRYIIVAKESERSEVIEHIGHGTGKKYDAAAVERLARRIMTAEQIRDDV